MIDSEIRIMRIKNQQLMRNIIDFIDREYLTKGVAPTLREIATEFGITSACVSHYLTDMKKKGLIQSTKKSRSIRTTRMQSIINGMNYIPVVGSNTPDSLLLATGNIKKYVPVSKGLVSNDNLFILKVNDNSMIKIGIVAGDYVLVKQQETAELGQIIVTLINGIATLKRYYLDAQKNQVRLHSENDDINDIYFNSVNIQGVAIKVIKNLV